MQPQIILQNSFTIQLISNDSNINDLFNQYSQAQQQQKNNRNTGQPLKYINFDINLNYDDIDRGYCSDVHNEHKLFQKDTSRRKVKQIINQKQKRMSKKRTRVYIQMLENRVQQLNIQLRKQKKLNKTNKEYIKKLNQSQHMINGYFVGRQQIYDKLQKLLSAQNPNNDKILQQIGTLRVRQGVLGKDRAKAINYYFKQMLEMFLPQIQKYLIKSATQQSDMFDGRYILTGQFNQKMECWRRNMLQKLDLNKQARSHLPIIRQRIIKQKNIFDKLIQQFYSLKCELTKQARIMQIIFDQIYPFITPLQVGRCLCYADRYKFEKKLSIQQNIKDIFEKIKTQQIHYKDGNIFTHLTKNKN